MSKPKTITLAFTGASGMPYGMRLLEMLLRSNHTVYLLYSKVAQIVAQQEMDLPLPSQPKEAESFLNTISRFLMRHCRFLGVKPGSPRLHPAQMLPTP